MAEIEMDFVQTARNIAADMDQNPSVCMPEDAAMFRGLADEIERLKKELIDFKLAWGDAIDAMDYAASEGFEWPKDPITSNIRHVIDTYCTPSPTGSDSDTNPRSEKT